MKELRAITIATAATLALISPATANPTQVTNVRVNPNGAGFDVVLETQGGKAPQVFNVNRGNTWNAFVFNAQITQPFRQNNPAPGITQISVIPSGANGVQVTVVGTNAAPIGQIAARNAQGVIFNVSGAGGGSAPNNQPNAAVPVNVPPATAQAQSTRSASLPTAPVAQALPNSTTPVAPFVPSAQVPNQGQPNVPVAPTPPLLRRAIAPPVGDQAISQIDTSPTTLDLGTNERIPRLVLRDAPVREVLSLLARAARLNLAYTDPSNAQQGQEAQQGSKTPTGPTVSIDVENESVQDVFNHVLKISGMEANRVGRTIFVGSRLPDDARNLVSRTIRLNQVQADEAAKFLSAQGAVSGGTSATEIKEVTNANSSSAGGSAQTRTETTTKLEPNGAPQLLTSLLVTTGGRLNTITLTGTPRKVEIATRFLGQLDARKRQVAINVKIVDVNLLKTEDFNTSFSFGIGNNFFNVDRGAAVFNFGQYRPPSNAEANASLSGRPIINNPYSGSNTFIDLNGTVTVPNTSPGLRVLSDGRVVQDIPNGDGTFLTRSVRIQNPFQPGITDITPATQAISTTVTDPTTGARTTTFAPGTIGSVISSLPTLFQFPTQFLARLQSQVTSGNAKILTDPTVVVQEGEKANVNLTQDVVTNTKITRTDTSGVSRETVELERQEAGLKLDIALERIDDNGFVSVRINPSVTAPVNSVDTGAGRVVLLSRREIQSGLIRLRDGQTLILSGIIQESDRSSVRKVPILGDLPLLGSLFRSTNRENQRQEVVVMLTPQILDDSDQSNFGYGYVPGRETRQFLQQQENR